MFDILNILNTPKNIDALAAFLGANPATLKEFEDKYLGDCLPEPTRTVDHANVEITDEKLNVLCDDIVNNLLSDAEVQNATFNLSIPDKKVDIDRKTLMALPEELRPMLTDRLMIRDIENSPYELLFWYYKKYVESGDEECFMRFKQGLSILDLDPVCYETLSCNMNSMGYWFPKIHSMNRDSEAFKIPNTTIMKVPMPVLQLSRLEYSLINPITKKIVNDFVHRAFLLEDDKTYFVKTGTFSNKFDFRNCKVSGSEVKELGEYLLYDSYCASQMASPLNMPSIVGPALTNEWVVREFIEDPDDNPTIYKGLPLRTEFRVFVDFDTNKVLSVVNYWDEKTMLNRFEERRDNHDVHDLITFKANLSRLNARFEKYKDIVREKTMVLLESKSQNRLTGQWSMDVMLSGEDFYIIDMALAEESYYYQSVPLEDRRVSKQNWIPKLS